MKMMDYEKMEYAKGSKKPMAPMSGKGKMKKPDMKMKGKKGY